MSSLERANEKNLSSLIEQGLRDTLQHSLFETVNQDQILSNVSRYMQTLKSQKSVNDYTVGDFKYLTWEDTYPDPQERQLAIQASGLFGDRVTSPTREKPKHLNGYPYILETHYNYRLLTQYIFLGQFSIEDQYWQHCECESELPEDLHKYELETIYVWTIDNPEGQIRAEFSFQPASSLDYITFDVKLGL